jgi:hypothetical protein
MPQGDQISERLVYSELLRDLGRHHPAVVLDDSGILQKMTDITAQLPQSCGNGKQAAETDGAIG